MIIFAGSRDKAQPIESKQVYYWGIGDKPKNLPLFENWCTHSPTGFEWGYGGSGPAQLAWVLVFCSLIEVVDIDTAREKADLYHQGYKWAVIAGLPYEGWQISSDSVLDWLREQGYNPSLD